MAVSKNCHPILECDKCVYTNVTEKGILQHIRMKHWFERRFPGNKFKCDQCDTEFENEKELKWHQRHSLLNERTLVHPVFGCPPITLRAPSLNSEDAENEMSEDGVGPG